MRKSIFSSTDVQFLLTFVAGMGGFWLSGHLPSYLPHGIFPRNTLGAILVLALALVIYGLVMFLWSWLILGRARSLKASLIATAIAIVLALATTLTLTYTKIGVATTMTGLAAVAFCLYLAYGVFFLIGWAVARRVATPR